MAQTWEIQFKCKEKRLHLFKQWNKFPREIVKSLSLEILRTQLDRALSNLL